MSILRYDPTTRDWVILAPARRSRPHTIAPPAAATAAGDCPFCPGREALTPPEVLRVPAAPEPWRVRVVPNKFAALAPDGSRTRIDDGGLFRHMAGYGAHEVLIESRDHAPIAEQPVDQLALALRTLQERARILRCNAGFPTVIIFKNHGAGAGTSIAHPHWQLIAMPVVPRLLRLKQAVAADYFDATGRSLHGDLVAAELGARDRVIRADEQFVAFNPYASHLAFETWIVPRAGGCSFDEAPAARVDALAPVLRDVLARLGRVLGAFDFNLTIHSLPRGAEEDGCFRWHIEILPRLAVPAGFELGSGMAINSMLPEEAAAALRTADT